VELNACSALADAAKEAATAGLSPTNVYPVFTLLAVGMAVAVVWALLELFYYHYCVTKVRDLKRNVTERGLSMHRCDLGSWLMRCLEYAFWCR